MSVGTDLFYTPHTRATMSLLAAQSRTRPLPRHGTYDALRRKVARLRLGQKIDTKMSDFLPSKYRFVYEAPILFISTRSGEVGSALFSYGKGDAQVRVFIALSLCIFARRLYCGHSTTYSDTHTRCYHTVLSHGVDRE